MSLPYAAVQFTTAGNVADESQLTAAAKMVHAANATDVLLLAHGWNNDMPHAQALFNELSGHLGRLLSPSDGRVLAMTGVLWPSIRWADEDDIAGGGASVLDTGVALRTAIRDSVEEPKAAERLLNAADNLGRSATGEESAAWEEFVGVLRSLLPADSSAGEDPLPGQLADGDPHELYAVVADAVWADDDEEEWAADATEANGSTGANRWFPDPTEAPTTGAGSGGLSRLAVARTLLNLTTYYTMRDRAGKVGALGVASLVGRLHRAVPEVRIHLAGHSFGARVMASAAATTGPPISSVTLLQGAFSHYGFAANYLGTGLDGAFRSALGRLHGPVVVTHTRNDRLLRLAYSVASRVARQTGAAIGGGERDPYGGIGVNGALGTSEADNSTAMEDTGFDYRFQRGRVYNLRADNYISGHSNVTGEQVAYALLRAMLAGG